MRWPCGAEHSLPPPRRVRHSKHGDLRSPPPPPAPPGPPSSSNISSWSSKAQWTSSSASPTASVAVFVPASAATLFFRNKGFWCHTAHSCGLEVFSKKVTTASSFQHRVSPPYSWQKNPAWPRGAARAWSPRTRLCSGASEAAEVSDCPSTHPVVGPS